jgi:hypothetical protein
MKATIEFNLPEEQEAFEDATNGWKWGHAMWQLDQFLRTKSSTHLMTHPKNPSMLIKTQEMHSIAY